METVIAVVAVVGLVVSLVSGERSRKAASQARKAQKRAAEAQGNRADLENARTRRQQLVASRRKRAAAIAQADNQGISGGSQISGVQGSIQSQAASNVSFLNQLQGLDQNRFNNLEEANKHLGEAATFQAIGNLGAKITATSGAIANLGGSSDKKDT